MHTTVGLWEQTGGENALCPRVAQSQQAVHKVSQADQVLVFAVHFPIKTDD